MTTPPIKKIKRSINGILLLDKPKGVSSNAALQRAKHLFQAKKAGHTGSLDPLASGMLPICFGEATKFSQYLLGADKTYQVGARLGIRTETGDAEGEIIAEKAVEPYTLEALDRAFDNFRGEIQQVPSMYSALKYQGQPLYKLARQGITVERPARAVTVFQLAVTAYQDLVLSFELRCSKGTYVRTIVDDFGELLGCGAHVVSLRRTSVGEFEPKQMYTFEQLEQLAEDAGVEALDKTLLPLEQSVLHFPRISMTDDMIFYFRRGQAVMAPNLPQTGIVAVSTKSGKLIGLGEITETGQVAPKRLIKQ